MKNTDRERTIDELVAALNDEDWAVRLAVTNGLAEIGPAAKKAVPALLEALDDKNWNVRFSALCALRQIDHKSLREAGVE